MEQAKLLSIGTLSKLTGVHIKSLRYYGEIGVLPPAWVDPETGYRYYSLAQIHVVEAIQFCVALDIPLKQFSQFMGAGENRIHYARLLARGAELADAKIRDIRERLDFLRRIEKVFARGEALWASGGRGDFDVPEKVCLTAPYAGGQDSVDFYRGVGRLFQRMEHEGLRPGYDVGLLRVRRGGEEQSLIFADVDAAARREGVDGLIVLPAARYRFLHTRKSDIGKASEAFPELFARDYDRVVLETQAYVEVSDPSAPLYELCCSLPPEGAGE